MTDTDTDPTNLGGQLRGPPQGQPQGPPQNPFQMGGGRNPWQMALSLIAPPQGQPGELAGEREDPVNMRPQDYIAAEPREDHTQWGKPDHILEGARNYPGVTPGPFMPFGQAQMAQVFHQSAAGLANFGSSGISPMGAAAAAYQTNYIKGLMQGQEWRARMAKLKMEQAAAELQEKQDRESLKYAEIFSAYENDPKLKDKLREYAIGTDDHPRDQIMLDALNTSDGIAAAKRLQSTRDWHNLNLAKTNQQRKDEEAEKATEQFLEKKPPDATPSSTTAKAPTGPPAPVPVPVLPKLPDVSDGVRQAATEQQMGRKPTGVPKTPQAESAVSQYQNALDHYMRTLTDPNSQIPPDRIMPLIRNANPDMADLTQNLLDGTSQPTATESVKEPFATALNLARKINPEFRRDWALRDAQTKQMEDRARIGAFRADISRLQQDLSGLRRLVPKNVKDMDYLIELAKKTNKSGIPVLQRWINAGKRNVEGDTDVTQFNTQLEAFRRDAGQILTSFGGGGRGQYTVYAQRHMQEFLTGGETPQQLEAVSATLKRDYENLLVPTVNELNHVMQEAYGDKYIPENADDILATLRGSSPENLPRPTSMDEARKLPPGTKFIDPSGKVRTRP